MNRSETICTALCTKAEFGRLIGVGSRKVSQLVNDGTIMLEEGKVVSQESLQRYVAALQGRAEARSGSDGLNLVDERAKLTVAQRQILEMKLKEAREQVVSNEDVRAGWLAIAAGTRGMLDRLPDDMAAAMGPHITAHDRKVMREVSRDALVRLSEELRDGNIPGAEGPDDLLPRKGR